MRTFGKSFLMIAVVALLAAVYSLPALAGLPPKKTPEELGLVLAPYEEGYEITGYTGEAVNIDLTRLIVDKPVLRVGEKAFYDSIVEQIKLPDTLRSLGEAAFSYSQLRGITTPAQVMVIPKQCFAYCIHLTRATIQENVQRIEAFAFQGCEMLQYVLLPETLTYLGESAFEGTYLWELILPAGITEIPDKCFYTCRDLHSIQAYGYLTRIGAYAFGHCPLFYKFKFERHAETLTEIGEGAFCSTALVNVIIPPRITVLPDACFEGCERLMTLKVPEGLTKVGDRAACGCRLLFGISLPQSVTEIGAHAFDGSRLSQIQIPKGVTVIREGTFCDCKYLRDIELPQGISAIEDRAFSGCSLLKRIVIPETVISLGENVFESCGWLQSVDMRCSIAALPSGSFMDCAQLTSITLPGTLRAIGDSAFKGCKALKKITLPDTVEEIGEEAFSGCKALASLALPNSLLSVKDRAFAAAGLTAFPLTNEHATVTLGEEVFASCAFTSLTLPGWMDVLPKGTFAGCAKLKSASLAGGLRTIESEAFADCSALSAVTLNGGLTAIGDEAFRQCKSLKAVTLPDTLLTIGKRAFMGAGLKSLVLPAAVNRVDDGAFSLCRSLSDVQIEPPGNGRTFGINVFFDSPYGKKFKEDEQGT